MEAKVNYTLVGVIGLLLITTLITLLLWMSHHRTIEQHLIYVSYFKQDVSGLTPNAKIKLNGIEIGSIKSIALDKKDISRVEIVMRINKEIPVTIKTYTVLESQGLTGQKYISLVTQDATAPLLQKEPGQPYPVIPTEASFVTDVESSLKDTSEEIKILVARANDVLNDRNREATDKILENIEKISETIANNSDKINSSLASIEKILENTTTASKDFPAMAKKTVDTLDSIEQLAHQFILTGRNATLTLSTTNTAIQNMTDQLMPTAQQLLQQLNQMMSTLNQFGEDLSTNPSMLIRGKYPPLPGPGEK